MPAFRCLVGESYSGIRLLLNSRLVRETDAGCRDLNTWVRLVVCNGARCLRVRMKNKVSTLSKKKALVQLPNDCLIWCRPGSCQEPPLGSLWIGFISKVLKDQNESIQGALKLQSEDPQVLLVYPVISSLCYTTSFSWLLNHVSGIFILTLQERGSRSEGGGGLRSLPDPNLLALYHPSLKTKLYGCLCASEKWKKIWCSKWVS